MSYDEQAYDQSKDKEVVCPQCGSKVRQSHMPTHLKAHELATQIKRGEKKLDGFKRQEEE